MTTADIGAIAAQSKSEPAVPLVQAEEVSAPHLVRASSDEIHGHVAWAISTVSVLLFIFLVLKYVPAIGWPLVLATIGAYLCDPIVGWLEKKGVSRTVATGFLVFLGVMGTIFVIGRMVPRVVEQITSLPSYLKWAIEAMLDRVEQAFPALLQDTSIPHDLAHLRGYLQEHFQDIVSQVLPGAGSVVGTIVGGSLSVLSFVLGGLVIPVVGFFLLRGWPALVSGADDLIPSRQRPFIRARMRDIDRVLSGFVRGQLTMAATLSLLYSTVLSIIGLKLAVVVGLVTGFGNLVPYVGTSTGILLSVGFCLVDFGADRHLAMVLGTYAALIAADSLFITPRVVGPRVGLSPAAVIVSVLACGSLFGFGGVLLAVPSAAVLKVVARTLVETWRRSRTFQEG